MDEATIQRIREQFDFAPYPKIPVEQRPNRNKLFRYNMLNGFYLRDQQVVSSQGKSILDVGCGSGFTTLTLALANPGAKIVGIDISETSIELAKSRLLYHGFSEVEFYVLPVEELGTLHCQFDYINCDETLYLLSDPVAGLRAMASVLTSRAGHHPRQPAPCPTAAGVFSSPRGDAVPWVHGRLRSGNRPKSGTGLVQWLGNARLDQKVWLVRRSQG